MYFACLILAFPCLLSAQEIAHFPPPDLLIDTIKNDISENKVMLYSKSQCSYSRRIKQLLSRYPIEEMKVIELDTLPYGETMLNLLKQFSGINTVPQLYVNGTFVGGYTETQKLDNIGKLKGIFVAAGVI